MKWVPNKAQNVSKFWNATYEINNNNNNYDNLYGAVTRPYRYKDASQATKQGKP